MRLVAAPMPTHSFLDALAYSGHCVALVAAAVVPKSAGRLVQPIVEVGVSRCRPAIDKCHADARLVTASFPTRLCTRRSSLVMLAFHDSPTNDPRRVPMSSTLAVQIGDFAICRRLSSDERSTVACDSRCLERLGRIRTAWIGSPAASAAWSTLPSAVLGSEMALDKRCGGPGQTGYLRVADIGSATGYITKRC